MIFNRILIANRGEIACRIIYTLKRLGIISVAIYSDVDAQSLHTQLADHAYFLGKANIEESYHNIEKIIAIATAHNCDAIHPGYGFLSENADFCNACTNAGITFIGPDADTITLMGNKSSAKELALSLNIPITPGYQGLEQTPQKLKQEADNIGYPLLIKPTAGGGGKGMHVVHNSAQFESSLESAQRQGLNSFGNKQVMLEKYFPKARHIEVQIFGDKKGNIVHLFERECSIQRRYQKIIEECPAPNLDPKLRQKMTDAAVFLAKHIHYLGAGTIEFLVIDDQFYFIEMNTRLQVEHSITELTTQQDLVEWQLIVAAGERLPQLQESIIQQGHAIEGRIYAENPNENFIPTAGKIHYFQLPKLNKHIRLDTAIQLHDTTNTQYDPLLAKLSVYADNRQKALKQFNHALLNTKILGITTNIQLILNIIQHNDFQLGNTYTNFIDKNLSTLLSNTSPSPYTILAIITTYILLIEKKNATNHAKKNQEPDSPWAFRDAWRLGTIPVELTLKYIDKTHHTTFNVSIYLKKNAYKINIENVCFLTHGSLVDENTINITIDRKPTQAIVVKDQNTLYSLYKGKHYCFSLKDAFSCNASNENTHLHASIPGTVVKIPARQGDFVKQGDTLMVIEAMKMEHTITAPYSGKIKKIYFSLGDKVKEDVNLIDLAKEKT